MTQIPIATLSESAYPVCDIVGSELVFPDGHAMLIEGGVTHTESGFVGEPGKTCVYMDLGRPGVIATFYETDGVTPGPVVCLVIPPPSTSTESSTAPYRSPN